MPQSEFLRLHHMEMLSRANGPGKRIVLWTQGCTLNCPGCFNPQTHALDRGEQWKILPLSEKIIRISNEHEGLTISGGEPLLQIQPLISLLNLIKQKTSLSVILFTGYTWDETLTLKGADEVMTLIDVLIAGRYQQKLRLASGLRGSANKTIHWLTQRYQERDFASTPPAEVMISKDGSISLSGVDPVNW